MMASTGRARRSKTAAPPTREKTAESGDGVAVTRSRGRPRKNGDDATAAERRRTQIRMAQRAYRNRKETAIVTLEKRVKTIKAANEAMIHAFLGLHDFLAAHSGLLEANADIAQQLRRTTETILVLARQAGDAAEDGDEETAEADESAGRKSTDGLLEKLQQLPAPTAASPVPAAPKDSPPANATASMDAAAVSLMLWNALVNDEPSPSTGPSISASSSGGGVHCGHCGHPLAGQAAASPLSALYGGGSGDSLASSQPAVPATASTTTAMTTKATAATTGSDALSLFSPAFGTTPSPLDASFFAPLQDATGDYGQALPSPSPSPSSVDLLSRLVVDKPPTTMPTTTATTTLAAPGVAAATAYGTPVQPYPFFADLPSYLSLDSTFGLRLRRRAVESGLRLLTSPNPSAARIQRAFGCSARFESLESIHARLYNEFVSPQQGSSAPRWDQTPVTPQQVQQAQQVQQRWWWQRSPGRGDGNDSTNAGGGGNAGRGDDCAIDIWSWSGTLTIPGLEGTFYDCEEIELYLRQRGVDIPPGSDRVVVVVGDDAFPVETAKDHGARPPSPVGWSLLAANSSPRSSPRGPRRNLLTLDVERFVFELTFRGTCLGASPGFRREDVHEAFWKAVYR